MSEKKRNSTIDPGTFIKLDGRARKLRHHPTDFSIRGKCSDVAKKIPKGFQAKVEQLGIGVSRVIAPEQHIDVLMSELREDKTNVAHHIYRLHDTGEEIVITDRISLVLATESADQIKAIVDEYSLEREWQEDNLYVLKVTRDSGKNPLKIANDLSGRDGVLSSEPEILFSLQFTNSPAPVQPAFFKDQWHLSTDQLVDPMLDSSAGLNVTGAWQIAGGRGNSDIVIAVIDDGFDLKDDENMIAAHPAFKASIIDREHMRNHGDGSPGNVTPQGDDNHGTCVASVIFAVGDAMLGVAPGCTFLPLRIGSVSNLEPGKMIAFLEEVSPFADVVNCSFGLTPRSFVLVDQNKPPGFMTRLNKLLKSGGRRGNGLIIVFPAGNDDVPISLTKDKNKDGITFVVSQGSNKSALKLKNKAIHCGYSEIPGLTDVPGVVVVGSMTSLKRKADYSNWGDQVTVVAPSDNFQELTMLKLNDDPDARRQHFPELGIVAAINRRGSHHPRLAPPISNDNSTPAIEPFYTKMFGGTSAATALVSGVIGLMLSVNPNLTPKDVITILQETAEHDNDKFPKKLVDLDGDPNVKKVDGRFNADKRSLFFGSGKVDAAAAVAAAKAKLESAPPQ